MFTTGTDITTAVTDLINTGTLIIILLILLKKGIKRNQDITWIIAFIMFILVSITGFIIHGLQATQDHEINAFLRKILIVELSFMMAFYVISVICDIYGEIIFRRVLGLCLIPAVIFIAMSITIMNLTTYKNGFMVFAIYCILNQLVIIIILIRHLHDRTGLNLYLI
ncbi:MAG: hypothetical protein K6F55_06515, partial [Eubacterium sp.]|nr:hypothetical protein [Eubacterium sp.]